MVTIDNGRLTASINPVGAQLMAFGRVGDAGGGDGAGKGGASGGGNLLWGADARYWADVNPLLFPVCGSVLGDEYTYQGKRYHMPKHGFGKLRVFELLSQKADEVWFVLRADDETRAIYPFEFELRCGFALGEDALDVRWQVGNLGENEMPFTIGGHPGFACELDSTDIVFEGVSELPIEQLAELNYFTNTQKPMPLKNGRLELNARLFDHDALFFKGDAISRVSLADRGASPRIAVKCAGFPYIGLWTRTGGAPYISIEPWQGCPDQIDADGDIMHKPYMIHLMPGQEWQGGYRIELL